MAKLNLPNSLLSEYQQFNTLLDLETRTSSGDIVFVSVSSGVTYSTLTYSGGLYNNQGQNGMLLILKDALTNYIIFAEDLNTLTTNISNLAGTSGTVEKTNLSVFNLHANNSTKHNGSLIYSYNNFGGAL